jgi:hypothetical protein
MGPALGYRLNPPPGWPPAPAGFIPPPGWQPDPSWPPVPPGWQLWVPDDAGAANAWPASPSLTPGVHYYTADQPKSGTNGFAIAAFILGLVGGGLLSVIFGCVALSKIRQQPQRGKGLAIAGLCLTGVWVVILVVTIAVKVQTASQRSDTTGQIIKNGHLDVLSLRAGDCFQHPSGTTPAESLTQVTAVSCTTPHNAQVIALLPVSGSAYPGEPAFRAQAVPGCEAAVKAKVDQSKLTSTTVLHFLYPLPQAWTDGQHSISCFVVDSSPDLTSSSMK